MSLAVKGKTMPNGTLKNKPKGLADKHKVSFGLSGRHLEVYYCSLPDLTAARCQALCSISTSTALLTTTDRCMRDFLIRLAKSSRV